MADWKIGVTTAPSMRGSGVPAWTARVRRRRSLGLLMAAPYNESSDRFEWQIADLTLTERIARVDKRAIRRKVLNRLRGRISVQVDPQDVPPSAQLATVRVETDHGQRQRVVYQIKRGPPLLLVAGGSVGLGLLVVVVGWWIWG